MALSLTPLILAILQFINIFYFYKDETEKNDIQ